MLVVTDPSTEPFPGERTVVTIGTYDGLHRGHQAVIAQLERLATELGARSVVVTFERHPATIVRPESAPCLLTDNEQRLEIANTTNLDAAVVLAFDETAASEPADDFVKRVLVDRLHARAVVVGSDFHFGKDRGGTIATLEKLGEEYDFTVEPVELLDRADDVREPISSTAIRRALAGGNVAVAAEMLGRPFEVRGTVVQGDQRGRTIGFPTANVEVSNRVCLPADGVYAGWYVHPDGRRDMCAINIGRRPTFYEHAEVSLLEAHLLDYEGDLYGETAKVQFVAFLRSERKFDGIEALVNQLAEDVANTRRSLAEASTEATDQP